MVLVLRQHPPVDGIGDAAKSIPLQFEQPSRIIERLASNDRYNRLDTHLPTRSRQCVCPFRSNSAARRRRSCRTQCRPCAARRPALARHWDSPRRRTPLHDDRRSNRRAASRRHWRACCRGSSVARSNGSWRKDFFAFEPKLNRARRRWSSFVDVRIEAKRPVGSQEFLRNADSHLTSFSAPQRASFVPVIAGTPLQLSLWPSSRLGLLPSRGIGLV